MLERPENSKLSNNHPVQRHCLRLPLLPPLVLVDQDQPIRVRRNPFHLATDNEITMSTHIIPFAGKRYA